MFWKFVARWISAVSVRGKLLNAVSGSVDAPCCPAPAGADPSRAVARGGVRRGGAGPPGAREAVLVARDAAEQLQRVEVERDVGDGAVREHDAAVRGAALHADLGEARHAGGLGVQLA